MRPVFIVLVLLCCKMNGFSQFGDIYQPSSVYKLNNVRSRIMLFNRAKVRSRSIDNFDHNGYLIEHIDFDTSGIKYLHRRFLNRDSSGKAISEVIYNYGRFDTATKIFSIKAYPDTVLVSIEYDDIHKEVKRIRKKPDGTIVSETKYNFETFLEMNKTFYDDGSFLETSVVFEAPHIEKKITGVLHKKTGELQNWSISFKNIFDRSGRIKRRSAQREYDYPIDETAMPFFQEHDYQYMSNGLLMNVRSSDLSDDTGRRVTRLFDYKFW